MPPSKKKIGSFVYRDGASDFAVGTLRYAMWKVIHKAHMEGRTELRAEEIYERTRTSTRVEDGYYDWSKSKTPLNSISATATSCRHFINHGNWRIALRQEEDLDRKDGTGGKEYVKTKGRSAARASQANDTTTTRSAGTTKDETNQKPDTKPRAERKPTAESTPVKGTSEVGSPTNGGKPQRKRPDPLITTGLDVSPPSACTPKGGYTAAGTPLGEHGWPVGLSPLIPISPCATWEEASSAGRCSVVEAVAASQELKRWPLQLPVICGDKEGLLVGTCIVCCTCDMCSAAGGCLFGAANFEKHSGVRGFRKWMTSIRLLVPEEGAKDLAAEAAAAGKKEEAAANGVEGEKKSEKQKLVPGMTLGQWLSSEAQKLQTAGVVGRQLQVYWPHGSDGQRRFHRGKVLMFDGVHHHTVMYEDGGTEQLMLCMEWLEWNDGSPVPKEEDAVRAALNLTEANIPSSEDKEKITFGRRIGSGRNLPNLVLSPTSPTFLFPSANGHNSSEAKKSATSSNGLPPISPFSLASPSPSTAARAGLDLSIGLMDGSSPNGCRSPNMSAFITGTGQPSPAMPANGVPSPSAMNPLDPSLPMLLIDDAAMDESFLLVSTPVGEGDAQPELPTPPAAMDVDGQPAAKVKEEDMPDAAGGEKERKTSQSTAGTSGNSHGRNGEVKTEQANGKGREEKAESKDTKRRRSDEGAGAEEEDTFCPFAHPAAKRSRSGARTSHGTGTPAAGGPSKGDASPGPVSVMARAKELMAKIGKNAEAYIQGEWAQEPWPVQPYERLDQFQLPQDPGLAPESANIKQLLTTDRTKANGKLEKDMHCGNLELLQLDRDVAEASLWGIDCYTRENIHLALQMSGQEHFQSADARTEFVEGRLLPALNKLGNDGWDILKGLEVVCEKAVAAGEAGVAAAIVVVAQLVVEIEVLSLRGYGEKPSKSDKPGKGGHERDGVGAGASGDGAKPTSAALPPALGGCGDATADPNGVVYGAARNKWKYFRIFPKGVGVTCVAPGGLEPNTFVTEYLGEVYPPWRWFEKQDSIKKCKPHMGLPDFYNISLERPREDSQGYSVLFIDASARGSFGSRLSHSCNPNCQTLMVTCGERVTMVLQTIRRIEPGEELTWDYACVTESEKEFRMAICLCGSTTCRGSFLYFANSSSFTSFLNKRHTFLDRNAILLRASYEPVTEEDRQRLSKHGMKRAALSRGDGTPLPDWVVKWAALLLEFIELEMQELPKMLSEMAATSSAASGNQQYADPEVARVESQGVGDNRLQNLAITLNKIAHIMDSQGGKHQVPPLRPLEESEAIAHLWTGDESIGRRFVSGLCTLCGKRAGAANGTGRGSARTLQLAGSSGRGGEKPREVADMLALWEGPEVQSLAEVQVKLRRLALHVRALGPAFSASADLILLYSATSYWCTPEKYPMVVSSPVHLRPDEMSDSPMSAPAASVPAVSPTASNADGGGAEEKAEEEGGARGGEAGGAGENGSAGADAGVGSSNGAGSSAMNDKLQKKYRPAFMWGQLVAWFKQTIYDPSASLSADRRGTMSLPDPEAAIQGGWRYANKERSALLEQLEKSPSQMWPTGTIWSFKNPAKIYGSPMMDDSILRSKGLPPKMPQVLEELRSPQAVLLSEQSDDISAYTKME